MAPTAFLSHSMAPEDAPLLRKIEDECRNTGWGLYLAERTFSPTSIYEKVRNAIQSSEVVIVLITNASTSSAWVN